MAAISSQNKTAARQGGGFAQLDPPEGGKRLDVFQSRSRTEGQLGLGFGHHFLASPRVAHFARFTVFGVEGAEARQLHGVIRLRSADDGVSERVDGVAGLGFGDASFVGDGFGEFRFIHQGSPHWLDKAAEVESRAANIGQRHEARF